MTVHIPTETEIVVSALAKASGRHFGAPANIEALSRESGGASRQTWSFDAVVGGDRYELILRRDPPGLTESESKTGGERERSAALDRATEFTAALGGGRSDPAALAGYRQLLSELGVAALQPLQCARSVLKLQLPKAEGEASEAAAKSLSVLVNADGRYFVQDREALRTDVESLKRTIAEVAGDDRSRPVLLRADARTPHQAVVTALDALGQLGFRRISIATAPEARPGTAPAGARK